MSINFDKLTVNNFDKLTVNKLPSPVGYWVLYPGAPANVMFAMYAKPTDEQILNTEQLLGWKWRDA